MSQYAPSPFSTYGQAIVRAPTALDASGRPIQTIAPYQYQQPAPRLSIWDSYRAALMPVPDQQITPMQSAVTGLRHNGEGMLLAAALGLAHKHFGTLDFRGKYPVDGILAALLFALSIKEAGRPDGFSSDLRALSQSASNVMAYRKMVGEPKAPEPSKEASIPRNTDSDPILEAARIAGL